MNMQSLRNVGLPTMADHDKADSRLMSRQGPTSTRKPQLFEIIQHRRTIPRSTVRLPDEVVRNTGNKYYRSPPKQTQRFMTVPRRPQVERNARRNAIEYRDFVNPIQRVLTSDQLENAEEASRESARRRREREERQYVDLDTISLREIERIRSRTEKRNFQKRQAELEIAETERQKELAHAAQKRAMKSRAEAEIEAGLEMARKEVAIEMRNSPAARASRAQKRGRAAAQFAPDLRLGRDKRGRPANQNMPEGPPPLLALGARKLDGVLMRTLAELESEKVKTQDEEKARRRGIPRVVLKQLEDEAAAVGLISFQIYQQQAPGRWLSDAEKIMYLRPAIAARTREKAENDKAQSRKLRAQMHNRALTGKSDGQATPDDVKRYRDNLRRKAAIPTAREVACAIKGAKRPQVMRVFKAGAPFSNDSKDFNVGQLAQIPFKLNKSSGQPSKSQPVGAGRIVRIDEAVMKRRGGKKTWMVKCHYENLNGQLVDKNNKVVTKVARGKNKGKIPSASKVSSRPVISLLSGKVEETEIEGEMPLGATRVNRVKSLTERVAALGARQKIAVFKKQIRMLSAMLVHSPRFDGHLEEMEDMIAEAEKRLEKFDLPQSLRFTEYEVERPKMDKSAMLVGKRPVHPAWHWTNQGDGIAKGFTYQVASQASLPNVAFVPGSPCVPREDVVNRMLAPIASSIEQLKKAVEEGETV